MEIRFAILLMSELCICLLVTGLTWFEAQNQCRAFNKTLTLNRTESYQYYWTGYYKRTSHWMKIIGCYNESQLQPINVHETDLQSSSPGFCQEICLQKHLLLFAVQAIRCVCLNSDFSYLENQLDPQQCNYSCDNSVLLSKECGGMWTLNVFLTDLSSLELEIKSDCFSLQCGEDAKINDYSCQMYLFPICTLTKISYPALVWRNGMEYCKNTGSYLIGNISLSDITMACASLNNKEPRWIGVVRDQYVKADTGEIIAESAYRFIRSCEKCIVRNDTPNCAYETCNTSFSRSLFCSESTSRGTPSTVDVEGPTSTNVNYTKRIEIQTDSLAVKIVVPVVVVLLLSICAVVVGIYYIRKKNLLKRNPNVDQNYSVLHGRLDSTAENQYDHLRNVVYENSLN